MRCAVQPLACLMSALTARFCLPRWLDFRGDFRRAAGASLRLMGLLYAASPASILPRFRRCFVVGAGHGRIVGGATISDIGRGRWPAALSPRDFHNMAAITPGYSRRWRFAVARVSSPRSGDDSRSTSASMSTSILILGDAEARRSILVSRCRHDAPHRFAILAPSASAPRSPHLSGASGHCCGSQRRWRWRGFCSPLLGF